MKQLLVGLALAALCVLGYDASATESSTDRRTVVTPPAGVQVAPQSTSPIQVQGQMPQSLMLTGDRIQVRPGFTVQRVSRHRVKILDQERGDTATISCDPCKEQGSCSLMYQEGKLWCEKQCSGGCITTITAPEPPDSGEVQGPPR